MLTRYSTQTQRIEGKTFYYHAESNSYSIVSELPNYDRSSNWAKLLHHYDENLTFKNEALDYNDDDEDNTVGRYNHANGYIKPYCCPDNFWGYYAEDKERNNQYLINIYLSGKDEDKDYIVQIKSMKPDEIGPFDLMVINKLIEDFIEDFACSLDTDLDIQYSEETKRMFEYLQKFDIYIREE